MTTFLDLSSVPLEVKLWDRVARAVQEDLGGGHSITLVTLGPASWEDVLSPSSSGELQANVVALAAYLRERQLAPSTRSVSDKVLIRLFHHGDVVVLGDAMFRRKSGSLGASAITGNLTVKGVLTGNAFDCELMVAGDVDCAALVTDAEVGVGGTIRCRYARLGWYDCTQTADALEAELVIDHGMFDGDLRATVVFTCDDHHESLSDAQLEKLSLVSEELRDAVLEAGDDGAAAYQALDAAARAAVAAGRPLLRGPGQAR